MFWFVVLVLSKNSLIMNKYQATIEVTQYEIGKRITHTTVPALPTNTDLESLRKTWETAFYP